MASAERQRADNHAEAAPDKIADHGVAHSFSDRIANSVLRQAVRTGRYYEDVMPSTPAIL
jgi:hypothetical protein